MPDPQQPQGLKPTRLLRPWDFPGKSTGVGCHCGREQYLPWFPWERIMSSLEQFLYQLRNRYTTEVKFVYLQRSLHGWLIPGHDCSVSRAFFLSFLFIGPLRIVWCWVQGCIPKPVPGTLLTNCRATGFVGTQVGDRVDYFFERLNILAWTFLHKEGEIESTKENEMSPQEPGMA